MRHQGSEARAIPHLKTPENTNADFSFSSKVYFAETTGGFEARKQNGSRAAEACEQYRPHSFAGNRFGTQTQKEKESDQIVVVGSRRKEGERLK